MTISPRTLFRTVAFAEAVSWAGLLFAMFLKYGPADNPTPVRIFGSIHGAVFICFVLSVLYVRTKFRWNLTTFVVAGLSSIPPFCTVLFEVLADRRGLLTAPSVDQSPAGRDTTSVAASS